MFRAVILGAPASGKGTISSRIAKHFDIVHLSSGDLLRNEIKKNSDLGKEIGQFVSAGELVPTKLINTLIINQIKTIENKNVLIDGFPRTRDQAEYIGRHYPIDMAIALDVPVEEIVNRVKGRWVHVSSGRVYNETFNRPKVWCKDDITNEDLEQRPDDAPDAVRLRLQLYAEATKPLIEYYAELKILNSFSGRTSDEIWPKVRESLLKRMPPCRSS